MRRANTRSAVVQRSRFTKAWLGLGLLTPAALALLGGSACSSSEDSPANASGSAAVAGNATGGTGVAGAGSGGKGGVSALPGGAAGTPSAGSGGTLGGSSGAGGQSVGGAGAGGLPAAGSGGAAGESGSGGAPSGGSGGSGGASAEPRSAGCGKAAPTPPPKNQQQTMQVQGDTRYYLMDVPAGVDNQTPLMLVFGLHGYDMNNIAVVNLFNFTQRSGGKAITVWPQGEGPHPGDTSHWGDNVLKSTWGANAKNYGFIEQIITDVSERYCIDKTRIFIAGFSMGGFFTNQMACDHSDWFRAFAPVAGGGPQACSNKDVQSAIMVQHGTMDPVVELSSGESSRDFWRTQNGCQTTSSKSLNNCDFYAGCAAGKPVAWCTGSYDHYIPNEAASNIWSFFSSF